MRDILVIGIVVAVLPFVLRNAYVGVLLWTWISTMNPHKLAYGFAVDAPIAAAAAGATAIALFVSRDKVRLPINAIVVVLAMLVLWMGVTTYFAFEYAESMKQYQKVLKILVMTFIALAVIRELRHVDAFVWVIVASLGFFGVKGGLYTLATGGSGRVWGPPGGFIEGNNEIALAFVMTIPLMNYLRITATRRWVRHSLVGAMVLTGAAALGTQSRGALLAICAMGLTMWWRSKQRLAGGIGMVMIALPLLAFMPDQWEKRMHTIHDYKQDGSAMGRLDAWRTMFNLANDRLLGGGFDVITDEVYQKYSAVDREPLAAHSIYFQVLGEHGWIGLSVFLLLWILVLLAAEGVRGSEASLRRAYPPGAIEPEKLVLLAGMCQVSMIGFSVGGAFLSLAYFDLPFNILVIVVAIAGLRTRALATEVRRRAGSPVSPDNRKPSLPEGEREAQTPCMPNGRGRRSFGVAIKAKR